MIRSRIRFLLLGALLFMIGLVIMLPASLAGRIVASQMPGFAYSSVNGEFWQGRFHNASFENIPLGRLDYKLRPLPLILGKVILDVEFVGGAINGHALVRANRKTIEASNGMVHLSMAYFARKNVFGIPVTGQAQLNIEKFRFTNAGCHVAQVTVWTDFLSGSATELGANGFPMEGHTECEGQDLFLTLSGEGEEGKAELQFLIKPDLTYKVSARALPIREDVADALAFLGFEKDGEELNYGTTGKIREF